MLPWRGILKGELALATPQPWMRTNPKFNCEGAVLLARYWNDPKPHEQTRRKSQRGACDFWGPSQPSPNSNPDRKKSLEDGSPKKKEEAPKGFLVPVVKKHLTPLREVLFPSSNPSLNPNPDPVPTVACWPSNRPICGSGRHWGPLEVCLRLSPRRGRPADFCV